ncbi:hypothetical protein [Pseudonocardia lacus]|uniref:hypothetical protein n=1 Tax=Pseudonocardia lacus TaxID=2835865 RepID=UPI001BDDB989|nr:hypothetical protein [Pseudonocardia lacus]
MFGYTSPQEVAATVNAIQRYLVTETRLKIPAIFHNEALNGVVSASSRTSRPRSGWPRPGTRTVCGRWPDRMRRQMRSVGLAQALSPVMMSPGRSPVRWR